jgi:hypothetical protein
MITNSRNVRVYKHDGFEILSFMHYHPILTGPISISQYWRHISGRSRPSIHPNRPSSSFQAQVNLQAHTFVKKRRRRRRRRKRRKKWYNYNADPRTIFRVTSPRSFADSEILSPFPDAK